MKSQISYLHAAHVSAASNKFVGRKRHVIGLMILSIVPAMLVAGLVWIMTPRDDLAANTGYAFVDLAHRL